jgi:ABC-type phosphate transport system auxiliary subunit
MTEVNRVTAQNAEAYRQTEIKKLDKRHEELRLEERRVRANIKANEEARIEMNRRMNRPGQNVDRMA